MVKQTTFILIFIFSYAILFSQGIINNGANFYISDGAYIHAGTFKNLNSGKNPEINLNGTLELEGDWINNSSTSNIFINIESIPNGNLILSSSYETDISGTSETSFENLIIKNGIKNIRVNNCEIKGLLAIDGKLNLNSNKIILTNSNLDISYLSGYIFSETNPSEGLGEVQIKVGNTENTYNIPFGSGDNENDLMLTFSVVSAGNPSDATVTFATYPTSEKNQPFPPNISNLNTFLANKTINRFWEIAPNFSSNPNFSINLSYTDNDINNNDNIVEENLGIIRYNNSKNIWDDKTINTIINTTNNTASSEVISSNDFFNFWTLTEKIETPAEFNIPNGITPNNDGFNDTWIIEDLPENTKVKIFNRWGDKVFSSDNYLGEWDGGDLPSGAYYYIIILSDGTKYKGDVNILK